MRIVVVNHVVRERAVEHVIATLAREEGWHVTFLRPGNRRLSLFFGSLFILVSVVVLALLTFLGLYFRQAAPWWLFFVVAATAAILLLLVYVLLTRATVSAQISAGVSTAHKLLMERQRPNMVIATGYGAVIALREKSMRKLPTLLLSPGVGQYVRYMHSFSRSFDKDLTLSRDTSFTAVAHERRQDKTPIKDALDLSDTAPKGASELDIVAKVSSNDYEDIEHLRELVVNTFKRGWKRIAQKENATFQLNEKGNVQVIIENENEIVESNFMSSGEQTLWLDQDDLKLICNQIAPSVIV